MHREQKIVLLDFPIERGAEAFAIEDAVSDEVSLSDKIVLFTWRTEPTIMIGRFQNALSEVNLKALEEKGVDLVRRASGGGTIFTDKGCFQFSIIAPRRMPDGSYQKEINFDRFLNPACRVFRQMGIDCEISDRNDLLYRGIKFNGNSQHVSREKILYHGSVLYSTDLGMMAKLLTPQKLKLQSKGIKSVRQRVFNLEEIDEKKRGITHFQKEFEELLAIEIASQYSRFRSDAIDLVCRISDLESELPSLFERAKKIQREKYDNPEWIIGKEPAYTLQKEGIFRAGFIKAFLDVKNGIVSSLHLEGDFFTDEEFLKERSEAFKGLKYSKEAFREALYSLCDEQFFHFDFEEMMSLFFD